MNYGLPYKGSKNLIAKWVVANIERGEVFIDLFAGGCAVTHAALLSHRFGRIVANDIADAPMLFCKAVNGDYRDEARWISREDFAKLKDTDPYVRYCWSFGNNGVDYMYSKEVEPWKKALHWARVFGDSSLLREFGIGSDGSRADIINHCDEYKKKYVAWYVDNVLGKTFDESLIMQRLQRLQRLESLESLGRLERLQSLESLESLGRLERLQRLECSQKDYRDVEIPDNAVVYCDIPYRGTDEYNGVVFEHEAFYDWVRRQTVPVYISEYSMPDDFYLIAEIQHRSRLSGTANNAVIERLYGYNTHTNKQLKIF